MIGFSERPENIIARLRESSFDGSLHWREDESDKVLKRIRKDLRKLIRAGFLEEKEPDAEHLCAAIDILLSNNSWNKKERHLSALGIFEATDINSWLERLLDDAALKECFLQFRHLDEVKEGLQTIATSLGVNGSNKNWAEHTIDVGALQKRSKKVTKSLHTLANVIESYVNTKESSADDRKQEMRIVLEHIQTSINKITAILGEGGKLYAALKNAAWTDVEKNIREVLGDTNAPGIRQLIAVLTTLEQSELQHFEASDLPKELNGRPRPPYIGVCDVYDPGDARAMADKLKTHRADENRKLLVGVMAHPLSLHPEIGRGVAVLDRVREVFPVREKLADAFTNHSEVINCIHYADLYGPKAGQNVFRNLEFCVKYGGPNLHAIQLDLTWPKPSELFKFKRNYSQLIILQIGPFALREAIGNTRRVIQRLRAYGNSIDYIFLDASMGRGIAMNARKLVLVLSLIQKELPHLGLAVGGGLGPETVHLLRPIAKKIPYVSIDAQGNLKPKNTPRDALGHLIATYPADLHRSIEYIKKSCSMLK